MPIQKSDLRPWNILAKQSNPWNPKKVTTDSGWTSVYPKFTKTTKTNVKYEFFFC